MSKVATSVVTPPSIPFQKVMPQPPDVPSDWLLEDEVDDDEIQITFEGRTFHILDTSSFDVWLRFVIREVKRGKN
jgi:hypothetical protein